MGGGNAAARLLRHDKRIKPECGWERPFVEIVGKKQHYSSLFIIALFFVSNRCIDFGHIKLRFATY